MNCVKKFSFAFETRHTVGRFWWAVILKWIWKLFSPCCVYVNVLYSDCQMCRLRTETDGKWIQCWVVGCLLLGGKTSKSEVKFDLSSDLVCKRWRWPISSRLIFSVRLYSPRDMLIIEESCTCHTGCMYGNVVRTKGLPYGDHQLCTIVTPELENRSAPTFEKFIILERASDISKLISIYFFVTLL
jgi:hypothetical protein